MAEQPREERPDPLDAIAFAIRRAVARKVEEEAERRAKMTVVDGKRRGQAA